MIDYPDAGDRGILVKRNYTDDIPPVASIAVWEVYWFRRNNAVEYSRIGYHTENNLTIAVETGRMKLTKA